MLEQICIGLETPWNSMHIAIMPEKHPKRPNNNAKALESWEKRRRRSCVRRRLNNVVGSVFERAKRLHVARPKTNDGCHKVVSILALFSELAEISEKVLPLAFSASCRLGIWARS
jgi:hypothetical protein